MSQVYGVNSSHVTSETVDELSNAIASAKERANSVFQSDTGSIYDLLNDVDWSEWDERDDKALVIDCDGIEGEDYEEEPIQNAA